MVEGNGGSCPPCEAKIVLNGEVVQGLLRAACTLIYQQREAGIPLTEKKARELISIMDDAESRLGAFLNEVIKDSGYDKQIFHLPTK